MSSFQETKEWIDSQKNKLANTISNETALKLYGWYKQATRGDNTDPEPWRIQLEAHAKWSAWTRRKGISQDDAKREYITLVEKLQKSQTSK